MSWIRQLILPPEGSTLAREIDDIYMYINWVSAFFFVLIAALVVFFVIKYRRRDGVRRRTPHFTHHLGLEIAWSVIPLFIMMIFFVWGFRGYMRAQVAPSNAMEIQLTAKRWLWQFEYPDGMRTLNDIHVPINKPVKLIMSSEDVLHSFFVPTFRVKFDIIPNRYTELWFTPTVAGVHQIFCTEYCGKGHSEMLAKVHVDTEEVYQRWVLEGDEELKKMPLPQVGKIMYENKGCNTCHSLDGTRGQGPSFKGIFGKDEKLADGKTVRIDETYIRESILQPNAKVVAGFESIMPTFQGLLRERELLGLIEFIKRQK